MPVFPIPGPPGVKTARRASFRTVFKGQGVYAALPGGGYIDGDQSGDAGNSPDTRVLRAGLLMGKITATGLYQAPGVVPTPATVTIRATSVADSTLSATATVTVQSVVQVTVSPPTATVTAGTQRQFTAFVSGSTTTAVTWRVNNIV